MSPSGCILPIWGEVPTVLLIETKICLLGNLPNIIMYAKF